MKELIIIGNWKSNLTAKESVEWLLEYSNVQKEAVNKKIIVCPPFLFLPILFEHIQKYSLPLLLGAQDISRFNEGAYTGEVNGKQLKEFVKYVLIGHSERRQNFHETDEIVEQKVKLALSLGIIPIVCVSGVNTPIPNNTPIVAYEPIEAIGTGNPQTPEQTEQIASEIKKNNKCLVLYGGSVTSENVHTFTSLPSIDGVLVGGSSLNPIEFSTIGERA